MEFSSNFLWHLASVAVRSLGLAGLAWAALAVLRVQAAAVRHAVWTVVVAAMLAMAALEPLLPPLPLPVLRAPAEPAAVVGLALPVSAPSQGAPIVPRTPVQRPWPTWPQALAALYLAGLVALLVRLAFGYLFTRRLVRASRRIERHFLQSGATDLYESSWISVPLTLGWLRPRILLPAGWEQWEDAKLQAVLAHERTHVRRADWAIAVLAGLNRSIFWFHPLAWWLERHLAFLAEQACDDAALMLVATEPYAQALLDMAAAVKTGEGRLVWEAMAMANVTEVRRRIERILDETRQIPRGLTRSRWVALIAASLPVIYVASVLQLAPARAQQAVVTPPAIAELIKGRKQLTPGDVSTMEQYLATNPHDLDTRTQLVLYYFANGTREPRLSHMFWLIANHPESNQAAFTSRGIMPSTTAFNDAADFARAVALWKQQAAAHSTDTHVLANAAEFLSQPGGDPDEAERLLLAARGMEPMVNITWAQKLGKLYATAVLGESGDPRFPSLNGAFASRVKGQLESSTDQWVLHFTGTALANVARRPEPGKPLEPGVLNLDDHAMLVPVVDLGNRLVSKAEELGVPKGLGRNVTVTTSTGILSSTPRTIGHAAAVPANPTLTSAPPLVNKVDPVYPPLARQARVQGVAKLLATIGTDGHVTKVEVIMGHPLLIQAAMEAVKQWVYSPIPAAGTLEVDVPFTLPPQAQAQQNGVLGGTNRTFVFSTPQSIAAAPPLPSAPPMVSRVEPVYPPLAQQARIQGVVKLMGTIGTDGHITHMEVISGHPLLVPAALEAVKQWVYTPIPTAGSTEIDVPFTLTGQEPPIGVNLLTPRKSSAGATIRIGGQVQAAKLVSKVDPVYPQQAKDAGIEGTVTLEVTIGQDGHVQTVDPKEGHPLLAAAAADAVKQWVYKPTLFNETPCVVITTVSVTFPN